MAQAPPYVQQLVDEKGVATPVFYRFLTQLAGAGSGTFAQAPTKPALGQQFVFTDSPVNTWAATITTGGGVHIVLAWWNSGGWRVMGA